MVRWTKRLCRKEASKYESLKEFRENSAGAYRFALKNDLLGEFDWLEKYAGVDLGERLWSVYVYELKKKHAYVGLTRCFKTRDNSHRTREGDTLFDFSRSENMKIPSAIIVKSKLTAEEAQKLEGETVEKYKNSGWTLLNKAKTGGLGGGTIKWTEDTCREAAVQCESKHEFWEKFRGAYNRALEFGWIEDYDWFKRPNQKPVVQYDFNGEYVGEFDSVREASDILGIRYECIGRSARGKRYSAGGWCWRFREDVLDSKFRVLQRIKLV